MYVVVFVVVVVVIVVVVFLVGCMVVLTNNTIGAIEQLNISGTFLRHNNDTSNPKTNK